LSHLVVSLSNLFLFFLHFACILIYCGQMSREKFKDGKLWIKQERTKDGFSPKLSKSILTALILAVSAISSATTVEAGPDERRIECLDYLIVRSYEDAKHVLTSPFHWNRRSLITFAILSTGTFGLIHADEDVQDWVQERRNSTTDGISKWTDKYTKRTTGLTIGGFYLGGMIFRNKKAKETALLSLESVALAEGITKGIKYLVGRTRPFGNKGASHFDPLEFPPPSSSLSFPSGHATTAFALSSVIAEQYGNLPLTIALYGWATVVALARVNNNAHFVSDVFWGGVIGISVGKTIVRFNRKKTSENVRVCLVSKSDLLGAGVAISIE
jgi:membrane-associated phospholipid phosphatase